MLLLQVYVSKDNIDKDLVDSIVLPAQDRNAPEVFYRVITSRGESINSLLQKIKVHCHHLLVLGSSSSVAHSKLAGEDCRGWFDMSMPQEGFETMVPGALSRLKLPATAGTSIFAMG